MQPARRQLDAASAPEAATTVAQLIGAWRAIDACNAVLAASIEQIAARRRLNQSQLLALYTCWEVRPEGVHQSQLAQRIGISPPQASALVEQLRRQSLLAAERSATDRRRQLWSLTPAGSQAIEAALDDLHDLSTRTMPHVHSTSHGGSHHDRHDGDLVHKLAAITAALSAPSPRRRPSNQPPALRLIADDSPSVGATPHHYEAHR